MAGFSDLRLRNKEKTEALRNSFEQLSGTSQQDDPRFWYPHRNEDGNAIATIRFLPALGDDPDYVRVVRYKFTGPGGQYSEKSLTTLGQSDPVAKLNSEDWGRGELGQAAAKGRTQKKTYYCNIFVLKDLNHPENEGKVFLYRFGPQLYDMIKLAMYPTDPDETPINAFSPFAPPKNADAEEIKEWIAEYGLPGANLRVRVTTKAGEDKFPDYATSKFESASPLGSDAFIDDVCAQAHALRGEFLDPTKFKSYDELEAQLHKVLALGGPAMKARATMQASSTQTKSAPATTTARDDDDDLTEFERLLNSDD